MMLFSLILLIAITITANVLSYRHGIVAGERKAHAESMGNYLTGFEKGRTQGYKQGEEKGRREGYEDGKRYAMAVEHNRKELIAAGILPDDGTKKA